MAMSYTLEGRRSPGNTPVFGFIGGRWVAGLIVELESQNRDTKALYVRKGRGVTGTYAVKELVYAGT